MRAAFMLGCLLLAAPLAAQTVKGPVDITMKFDHTDQVNTDRYELCVVSSLDCAAFAPKQVEVQTITFAKTYSAGAFDVAVRACNAFGCSALSNAVRIPRVVITGPERPTTLVILSLQGQP